MSSIRNLSGQGWSGGRPETLDHRRGKRWTETPEIGDQSPVVTVVKANLAHIVYAYTLCLSLYYVIYWRFALTTVTTGNRVQKSAGLAVEVAQ